jgi:hypothetical protein
LRIGGFDVIAITDHILMNNDIPARAGRIAMLRRRGKHFPYVANSDFCKPKHLCSGKQA